MNLRRFVVAAVAFVAPLLISPPASGQSIRGSVVDQTGLPLPGVQLDFVHRDGSRSSVLSGNDGRFELPDDDSVESIEATLEGFEPTKVAPVEAVRIVMRVTGIHERTDVTASPLSSGVSMESLGSTFTAATALRMPTARPRALESLPLLPSVVRGPDGLLRLDGTRPHEATLWIDGFDVTDPVSGTSAIDLPLESVRGVAVLRDPMAATFGGTLGALASIETVEGGDTFSAGVQGFIPRPRLSRLGFGHIEGFFPRTYAGGRLGKLRYFVAEEFDFEHVPVPGVTTRAGHPNIGEVSSTSFVRMDVAVSSGHTLTLEGLFVPGHTAFNGLSPLRPRPAAPTVHTRDAFVGIVDRLVLDAADVLMMRVGVVSHGTALAANGSGPAHLTPAGWRGNWFASIDHWASRQSAAVSWEHAGVEWLGVHSFSTTLDLQQRAMHGTLGHQPIQIENEEGVVVRLIEFGETSRVRATEIAGSLVFRDTWHAVQDRLQFDVGARADRSDRWHQNVLSPRIGVRYALDPDGVTVVKGGLGRFVGRLPLAALAFGSFPTRSDTEIDPMTGEVESATFYQPTTTRLPLPRANTVTIEVERRLRPGLDVQIGARRRLGSELTTVNLPAAGSILRASSSGTSAYRELQLAVRQVWNENAQLFVSYVRSAARGDLNDFGSLFVDMDTPQLEANAHVAAAADAPVRWVGWGTFSLPHTFVVSPAAEWHTGFPYSALDIRRHYEGAPNSLRFPAFFSLDIMTYKTVTIRDRQVNLGIQLFNVTRHFNPRDVMPVSGTSHFGRFTNSIGLTVGGYMRVKWE